MKLRQLIAIFGISLFAAVNASNNQIFYRFPSFNETWLPLKDELSTGELQVGQHYRLELVVMDVSRFNAYFRRRFQFELELKIGEARKTLVKLKEAPWYKLGSKKTKKRSYGDEITSSVGVVHDQGLKEFAQAIAKDVKKIGRLTKVVMVFSVVSPALKAKLILRIRQTYPRVFPSDSFEIQEGESCLNIAQLFPDRHW
jgi:hypothetical protein